MLKTDNYRQLWLSLWLLIVAPKKIIAPPPKAISVGISPNHNQAIAKATRGIKTINF
ncbi:MAG: hypothetical protein AB4206_05205 [Xenococcaceae cyanobacterium]